MAAGLIADFIKGHGHAKTNSRRGIARNRNRGRQRLDRSQDHRAVFSRHANVAADRDVGVRDFGRGAASDTVDDNRAATRNRGRLGAGADRHPHGRGPTDCVDHRSAARQDVKRGRRAQGCYARDKRLGV